ncbi:MAG: hypothetical protein ACREGE_03265 [Candidatus Microsaccharimonas sp.]
MHHEEIDEAALMVIVEEIKRKLKEGSTKASDLQQEKARHRLVHDAVYYLAGSAEPSLHRFHLAEQFLEKVPPGGSSYYFTFSEDQVVDLRVALDVMEGTHAAMCKRHRLGVLTRIISTLEARFASA